MEFYLVFTQLFCLSFFVENSSLRFNIFFFTMRPYILQKLLRGCCSPHVYCYASRHSKVVLGIETSCDETGAAVVDEHGKVLGEGLHSQLDVHLQNGGVIPHIASYLHSENIHNVVTTALRESNFALKDVSAIAVTTKPGLASSLVVGLQYAKALVKESGKLLIPIHHMEAHALTVRMVEDVNFPFLVLLASGGHCQLAWVKNVEEFFLLGTSLHNSPGEVIDKIARRLKLQNLPECYDMSGGRAVEHVARGGNHLAFNFPTPMIAHRDCNFSFSGFGSHAADIIEHEERCNDVPPDGVIPSAKDFCSSLQYGIALHLVQRLSRAIAFCEVNNFVPENNKVLVFSGGVACNSFIRTVLKSFCSTVDFKLACPPPKLCTDNGIMIAWNGMEKLKENVGMALDPETVTIDSNCSLGKDITEQVRKASIKVQYKKIETDIETDVEAMREAAKA